jgi:hypothetical protein
MGDIENGCRLKHNLDEVDWEQELTIPTDLFGSKTRSARSQRLGRSNKMVLYFKTIAYGPLNYLVHADEKKNQNSYFYSLIKCMDEDSDVNRDLASRLIVS